MDLSPTQELAKRAAEAGGGLAAAAKALGLQDHQRLLRDSARRVRESHRGMAKAAGMEDTLEAAGAGDDLGDILVTGDINIHGSQGQDATKLLEVLKGKAVSQSDTPTKTSDKPSALGTAGKYAALAALMAGSGIGGSALYAWLNQTPAVAPDQTAYTNDGEIFEIK